MADSSPGGCARGCGCGCSILSVILFLLLVFAISLYFLKPVMYSPGTEQSLFAPPPGKSLISLANDICSCSIPDSFSPVAGIDMHFFRGAVFSQISSSTNAYIILFDSSLFPPLSDSYKEFIEPSFNKSVQTVNTRFYEPYYINKTSKIERCASYIHMPDGSRRAVFEAWFHNSNQLVMAAFITHNTNLLTQAQDFITSIRPAAGNHRPLSRP